MQALFDPARHEPLTAMPWSEPAARAAIERIAAAAAREFDAQQSAWPMHPLDEPLQPGAPSFNLYWGAPGVAWALRHLAAQGAVAPGPADAAALDAWPERVRQEAADELHGTASYFFGESGPLLLAWQATGREAHAERLLALVRGNLHNTANEPLWGNAGTMLAAIHAAEATRDARWPPLLQQASEALLADMVLDPDTGTWLWQQDLYGHRGRHLGAGHGLAGNAYAALRAAGWVDAGLVRTIEQRTLQTLEATALRATIDTPEGPVPAVNWHPLVDPDRIAARLARGDRPLVQDCHGAPGIVCRLAGASASADWDALLRAAGELTWHAGPLAKGPSLCHGTAGSAMACLKLWRRFGEPKWLERARRLAMHAAEQVEQARARHGQGRHSLWTGDLGVACVLWNCIAATDHFPTLDHF